MTTRRRVLSHPAIWAVPPVGAATSVSLAGTSVGVWLAEPTVVGDWGDSASAAMLAGAALYAVALNLFAVTLTPAPGGRSS